MCSKSSLKKMLKKTFVFILYLCFGVSRKEACAREFGSDYLRLCSKSDKKTLENIGFREKQVFVGLRSSPSLFYIKNYENPPPGTPREAPF